jgi:LacI family transcriptional regulator
MQPIKQPALQMDAIFFLTNQDTHEYNVKRYTLQGRIMASIQDVANAAGVSTTLVSRVLNGKRGVSPSSRKKIANAMAKLNYTPNAIARSLVLQKTHIIGVVLDSLCEPYFFDLIRGIEQAVSETEYYVIFCSARDSSKTKNRYIDFFTQGRADGFILYGSNINDIYLINSLAKTGFPAVVIEYDLGDLNMNNIYVDNRYGSRCAVNYLVQRGCRRICHVTGPAMVQAVIHRQEGFMAAMEEHKLPVRESDIIPGDFSVAAGYRAIAEYINQRGKKALPDAFYFAADITACGGMMALEDQGIRIPEDVMVMGFDNDTILVPNRLLKPLSTLGQPLAQMGRDAVRVLIEDLENRKKQKEKIRYYPELFIRATTR